METRKLSQTAASEVNTDSFFPPTNWLAARDAIGARLVARSANIAESTWTDPMGVPKRGMKAFLHCYAEDDADEDERTISFSDRSPAYAQLKRILDEEGDLAFPFLFTVGEAGKSFRLEDAPDRQTVVTPDDIPF